MNRRKYLKLLNLALWGGFKRRERKEICADYAGFFEQGGVEGKSEEDVIAELGEPHSAALDLAREMGKRVPMGAFLMSQPEYVRFPLLFIAVLFPFSLYSFGGWLNWSGALWGCVCMTIFGGGIAWFIFTAIKYEINFRKAGKLIYAGHILLMLMTGSALLVIFGAGWWVDAFIVNGNIDPASIGPVVAMFYMVFMFIALAITVVACICVMKGEGEYIPLVIHAPGAFFCIWVCRHCLINLDVLEELTVRGVQTLTIYILAVVYTVGSWVVLKKLAVKAADKGAV